MHVRDIGMKTLNSCCQKLIGCADCGAVDQWLNDDDSPNDQETTHPGRLHAMTIDP